MVHYIVMEMVLWVGLVEREAGKGGGWCLRFGGCSIVVIMGFKEMGRGLRLLK